MAKSNAYDEIWCEVIKWRMCILPKEVWKRICILYDERTLSADTFFVLVRLIR